MTRVKDERLPPKIVYLLSSPHGGSTLLSHLLGSHSTAVNMGEVSFIPKLLSLAENCTCGQPQVSCPAWVKVFSELEATTGVNLAADPYGLFLGDAVKQKQGSGKVDRAQQTRWVAYQAKMRGALDTAALLGSPYASVMKMLTLPSIRESIVNTNLLYQATSKAWGASMVIDASKTLKKGPHLYLNDPDNVRIIHLARDGRGVVASRKKYMPVTAGAERWSHYHSVARRALDRWVDPAHRRFLRYEDLVQDPAGQLGALCRWLDIDFEDSMLDSTQVPESHAAGGNPARFSFGGGVQSVDERWRTSLDEADLAAFQRIGGRMNLHLGYV